MDAPAGPVRNAFPAQRRARLLDVLRDEGSASVPALCTALGASPATIRRDLDFLTRAGYLDRSHGGAVLKSHFGTTFEPDLAIEAQIAHAAKARIGAAAIDLLVDGQSVIFDSSSTVLEAAQAVARAGLALTAVTNDLRVATLFAGMSRLRTIVLGGTVRTGSATLTGEPGHEFLRSLHVDVALIGIHSVAEAAISETSIEVASMKRRMIGAARKVALLIDGSKFREATFCEVAPLRAIDIVLTDDSAPAELCDAMRRQGVDVRVIEAQQP